MTHSGVGMPEDAAEFGLLGPLSVTVAGAPVPIRAAKLRIVMASMLLRPGKPVSVEELVDRLWDDEPPGNGRSAIQTYVNRLRMLLGAAGRLIRTEAAGYLIDVAPSAIDRERQVEHFARAHESRTHRDLNREARMLRDGLALRRGAPLADVPSRLLQLGEVPRIVEDNLQAVERLNDVELALGNHASLVSTLQGLTAEYPLRERFWTQLMLALYRCDRQADALSVYRQINALLRDELGIEPGRQLRDLHQRIVTADRTLRATPEPTQTQTRSQPPAVAAIVTERWRPAFQLPSDIPDFVGRAPLVNQIQALIRGRDERSDEDSHAVAVTTLSGPPGIGKTALAVHVAHRLRPDFPDGQLYVDLRGHATSRPMEPIEALERLLRSVGIAPDAMPREADEKGALLRSTLADRRVLMLLDNAYGIDQVRPLLPGSRGCAVIVTSRNSLHGLTALHGARPFLVGSISAEEARALLCRMLGERRVAAEADAADSLAAACGYLPLALRIVAAKLAATEELSIGAALRGLQSGDRLAAMSVDGASEVTVHNAFELSYSALKPDEAELFRLLGLCPGPTFEVYAAAALAAVDLTTAQRLLDSLVSTNLLQHHTPGRYRFHDLIREYARNQSLRDAAADRRAAYDRLLAFYRHGSHDACKLLYSGMYRVPVSERPEVLNPALNGGAEALGWLDDEVDNLVAAISAPVVQGADPAPTWQLAATLLCYLDDQQRNTAWLSAFTAALAASERRGDVPATAALRGGLGRLHNRLADYELASSYYEAAIEAFQASQDVLGEARTLNNLAGVAMVSGAYELAADHYRRALELNAVNEDADQGGRSLLLTNAALGMFMVGRNELGTRYAAEGLAIAERLGQRNLAASAGVAIALKDLWLGRLEQAGAGFAKAIEDWREIGHQHSVADSMRDLAEVHFEAGRLERSRLIAEQALALAEDRGFDFVIPGAQVNLGWLDFADGEIASAEAWFAAAHSRARAGLQFWRPSAALGLAACHRRRGDLEQAASFAESAVHDGRPRERGRAHLEHARIAIAAGRLDEACTRAGEARRVAEHCGYALDEAHALELLGSIHRQNGDISSARACLSLALRGFEPENPPAAARVQRLVDEL